MYYFSLQAKIPGTYAALAAEMRGRWKSERQTQRVSVKDEVKGMGGALVHRSPLRGASVVCKEKESVMETAAPFRFARVEYLI